TGLSVVNSSSSQQSASGLVTTTINRTYDFQAHTLSGIGNYYTIDGKEGTQVDGGRPIQPHTSYNISMEGHIAHGVLMVGGTFTDITNFNPAVSQIITDELYIAAEPDFDLEYFYPLLPGTINRFLSVEGETRERLVVVPGQFAKDENAAETSGTQRLYDSLTFDVYHAPFEHQDFTAPSIWEVYSWRYGTRLNFEVMVTDGTNDLHRVVVLYRELPGTTWQLVELSYDLETAIASGHVEVEGEVEYFVQAVDPGGNVALALDHGEAFFAVEAQPIYLYLPLVVAP
ncbi:MAG: hypothetical protein GY943_02790, partial [Chloroflexi bacterium]|nr:hypothetical protein [Chloroflexota bacterium]